MSETMRHVEASGSGHRKTPSAMPSSRIVRNACFQRRSMVRDTSSSAVPRSDSDQASIHSAHDLDLPLGE